MREGDFMQKLQNLYKRKVIIVCVVFLLICAVSFCIFIEINKSRQAGAADGETWETIELGKLTPPLDNSGNALSESKFVFGRSTFFDYFSDSQIPSSSSQTTYNSITDGASKNTNTFKKFNKVLRDSLNNSLADTEYYKLTYPLYMGIFYYAQTDDQRGFSISTSDSPSSPQSVYNFWINANSENRSGTNAAATQGLINERLNEDGNPTIGSGNLERVLPYFDSDFVTKTTHTGKSLALGRTKTDVAFPFRKSSDGYYYYDSGSDVVEFKGGGNVLSYHSGAPQVYDNPASGSSKTGFFPFNHPSDGDTGGSGKASSLNFGFGMKTELTFNMTANGKIKGKDITFEFSGDDDLWVFVDDYLIMDIGGAHGPVQGEINFASKKTTVSYAKSDPFGSGKRYANGASSSSNVVFDFSSTATTAHGKELYKVLNDTSRTHTLTIFYMERGTLESNLYVKFNLPQVNSLSVGNEIDTSQVNTAFTGEGADLWTACNNDFFEYYLQSDSLNSDNGVSGTPITSPIPRTGNLYSIGLGNLRKSTEDKDNAIYQLKFKTFTGKNYVADVVRNARITLPGSSGFSPPLEQVVTDSGGNNIPYLFMGWTTASTYDWEKIKADKDTLGVPALEKTDAFSVRKSAEYKAVWIKENINITYKDTFSIADLDYGAAENLIGTESITQSVENKQILSFYSFQEGSVEFQDRRQELEKEGYQFVGWSLTPPSNGSIELFDDTNFSPASDMEFYAVWKKVKSKLIYKATTDSTGSQQPWEKSELLTIGTGISLAKGEDFADDVPTKHNYILIGWSPIGEKFDGTINEADGDRIAGSPWEAVYKDTTYYAVWKKVKSDITFHGDRGSYKWSVTRSYYIGTQINGIPQDSFEDIPMDDSTRKDNAVTDKNPRIKNYSIVGWTEDAASGDTSYMLSYPYTVGKDNVDLYGIWSKTGSTITYHSGTVDGSDTWTGEIDYANGGEIQIPTIDDWNLEDPSKAEKTEDGVEYVITGWTYADGKAIVKGDTVEEDGDVYAVWKKKWRDVVFEITVNNNMLEDWDADKCSDSRWSVVDNGASKTYSLTIPCLAGKPLSKSIGNDGLGGEGYDTVNAREIIDVLFAPYRDKHECSIITGWRKDSSILDVTTYQVPYEEDDGKTITLKAKWERNLNKVYFYSDNVSAGTVEAGMWEGTQTFSINADTIQISQLSPLVEGSFSSIAPHGEGYVFKGWSTKENDTSGSGLIDVNLNWTIIHGTKLYAVWEPPVSSDETDGDGTAQNDLNSKSNYAKSIYIKNNSYLAVLRTLSSASGLKYLFTDPHGSISSGVGNTSGVAATTTNGKFYLKFDEIATFLNAFTNSSNLRLCQSDTLYQYNSASRAYEANGERVYSKLYNTIWEMRDLHGFITDRTVGDHKGQTLSNMAGNVSTVNGQSGVYAYDGRVTSGGSALTDAFEFSNENTAAGASYVTDVRTIYMNQVRTGSISIKKELDTTAMAVAKRKGDINRTFTFRMYYWNVFGSGTEAKTLYVGEYTKVGVDGSTTLMTTLADGSILLKAGESAIISGIPVLTKYQISEDAIGLNNRVYYLKDVKQYVNDEVENSVTVTHTPVGVPGSVTGSYVGSFEGQIEEADNSYHYIVTNQIQVDGYDMYIEKIIDRYYYEEEFYPNVTYEELSKTIQSFTFDIHYEEVEHTGTTTGVISDTKSIISFGFKDKKTKQNKIVGIGPGYYEVSEDEGWSWKYQLYQMDLLYGDNTIPIFKAGDAAKNKVCRFYLPGAAEAISGDTKTFNGKEYHIINYDPVVSFTNHRKNNAPEGDTSVSINNIVSPGNTVEPTNPEPEIINMASQIVNAGTTTIYNGGNCSNADADITSDFEPDKLIDNVLSTVTTDANLHNPISIKMPFTSKRTLVKVVINSKSKLTKAGLLYRTGTIETSVGDYEEKTILVNGATIYTYTFAMPSPVNNVEEIQLLGLSFDTNLAGYHSLAEIEIYGYEASGVEEEATPKPTTPAPTATPEPKTYIYIKNSTGWTNAYLYFSSGIKSWPGFEVSNTKYFTLVNAADKLYKMDVEAILKDYSGWTGSNLYVIFYRSSDGLQYPASTSTLKLSIKKGETKILYYKSGSEYYWRYYNPDTDTAYD